MTALHPHGEPASGSHSSGEQLTGGSGGMRGRKRRSRRRSGIYVTEHVAKRSALSRLLSQHPAEESKEIGRERRGREVKEKKQNNNEPSEPISASRLLLRGMS